jgi:CspA family cold shock protein
MILSFDCWFSTSGRGVSSRLYKKCADLGDARWRHGDKDRLDDEDSQKKRRGRRAGRSSAPASRRHRGLEHDANSSRSALSSRAGKAIVKGQHRRRRMARGTVKWFNSQKGYGFIQPQSGGKDVFVHISAVERAGLTGLNEGQVVEYEEVANKGKTSAENLKVSH